MVIPIYPPTHLVSYGKEVPFLVGQLNTSLSDCLHGGGHIIVPIINFYYHFTEDFGSKPTFQLALRA